MGVTEPARRAGSTDATTVTIDSDEERDDDRSRKQLDRGAGQVDVERPEQPLQADRDADAGHDAERRRHQADRRRPRRRRRRRPGVCDAPSARSRASSRVRCATMIENVLKMMNEPTNSATNAKTSSAVLKKPSPSCNACVASSATVVDVTASAPSGRTASTEARSSEAATPSSPTTLIASNTPCLSSTRWAVSVSKTASVAPARLSASPNPAMPTIVNSPGGPWNRMRDAVADRQVGVARGGGVDHDLVRPGGRRALAAERQHVGRQFVPVRADRRRTDPADHLVGPRVDHLRVSLHVADGERHPGHRGRRRRARSRAGAYGHRRRRRLPAPPPSNRTPRRSGRRRRMRPRSVRTAPRTPHSSCR